MGFLIKVWNTEILYKVEDFINYIEVVKRWSKLKKIRPRILCQPSITGILKWNTDGVSRGNSGYAGISGVLYDEFGYKVCFFFIIYWD